MNDLATAKAFLVKAENDCDEATKRAEAADDALEAWPSRSTFEENNKSAKFRMLLDAQEDAWFEVAEYGDLMQEALNDVDACEKKAGV